MKKDSVFEWKLIQQHAFDEIKQLLSSKICLGYFDVKDQIKVFADASPVGLGAVLVQINEHTDVEKRYAQTEKKALALVWAVERFHFFLFGRIFDLVTDHKPLEVIFGPKSKPCARIERWVLRLQSYQYRVIYKLLIKIL